MFAARQRSPEGLGDLLQEPTLGRRFAIDATPISNNHLLFAVISSTKRWSDVEGVKTIVAGA